MKYYTFSNRVRKITVRGTKTFAAYELLGISQILITCKNNENRTGIIITTRR